MGPTGVKKAWSLKCELFEFRRIIIARNKNKNGITLKESPHNV